MKNILTSLILLFSITCFAQQADTSTKAKIDSLRVIVGQGGTSKWILNKDLIKYKLDKADSTLYSTKAGRKKGIDSIVSLLGGYLTPTSTITENQLQTTGKVFLSSDPNLEAYGTSYTAGYVSTTYANYGFPALIAQKYNKTIANRGVPAAADHWINFTLNNILGSTTTRSLLLEMGINTLRNAHLDVRGLEKYKASVLQAIARWWNLTGYPASSATIIKTGTWVTDVTGTPFPGAPKYSGTGLFTVQSGATASLTFTGNAVSIGIAVTDGTVKHSGSFDYYVDGVKFGTYNTQGKTDGVNDGNNDATIVNSAIILNNLGNASHTVSITTLSSDTVHLDFISIMKPAAIASSIVVLNLPKLPPVSSGIDNSDYISLVKRYNDTLTSIVANLSGYPIAIADQYNSFKTFYADNLHPNDEGHREIAAAISKKIYGTDFLASNGSGIISTSGTSSFIDFWNAGASVGKIEYNSNLRLSSTSNLSLIAGASGGISTSGGNVNSTFGFNFTAAIGKRNGAATATSAATQSGSNALSFENNLWNGSASTITYHGFKSFATSVAGESRLAMIVNAIGNQNLTSGSTEVAGLYSNGYMGIRTGVSNPATELDLNGAMTLRTVATPSNPASGNAVIWFDGTNLKVTKNVGGTISTSTIF